MPHGNPDPTFVLDYIKHNAEGKFDEVQTTSGAKPIINDSGHLSFELEGRAGEVLPTNSAELQYLTRISVQGQFFHRCSPSLKRHILEEFHKDKNFMFRCKTYQVPMAGDMVSRTQVRAVLGPQFPTNRDDERLFPIVLEALSQPNVMLASFEQTDHVTELIAQFSDTNIQPGSGLPVGDGVSGAISITNSETGHSSLWIEPHIQIFNGIWIGNRFGDKVSARYVHRGTMPTVEQLREDIEAAKRIVQVGIIQYLEACEQRIATGDAVKYMESLTVLPKRFTNIIANEIADQDRIMKTELLRRILLAAQELPLIQSLQIRREVGGFVGLFENTSSRLANLVNEIE